MEGNPRKALEGNRSLVEGISRNWITVILLLAPD